MREFAYVTRYLYSALRWRLFVWLTLIVLASSLEGITLGLFLPIIAGADSDSPLQRLFTTVFDSFGIDYTIPLALGAMTVIYALRTVLVVLQELYVARVIAGLMVVDKVTGVRPAFGGRLPVLHEAGRRILQQRRDRRVHQPDERLQLLHPNGGGGGLSPSRTSYWRWSSVRCWQSRSSSSGCRRTSC